MCTFVYLCVYIYIYMYIYLYLYVSLYIYEYIYIYICYIYINAIFTGWVAWSRLSMSFSRMGVSRKRSRALREKTYVEICAYLYVNVDVYDFVYRWCRSFNVSDGLVQEKVTGVQGHNVGGYMYADICIYLHVNGLVCRFNMACSRVGVSMVKLRTQTCVDICIYVYMHICMYIYKSSLSFTS